MLATLIKKPFNHADWIFEIKWDGFRAIAEINHTQVELYSRAFQSFNERFPSIVTSLKKLKIQAIFDGEIVVLDEKGRPSFQLLQNIQTNPQEVYYYVFDILSFKGNDLTDLPLLERKKILNNILPPHRKAKVRNGGYIEEHGVEFLRICKKNHLEGIIGKAKKSKYLMGKRSSEWVKIKTHLRQEAIICGFTEPRGGRKNIGALILGVYKRGVLTFIGHCGGGFTFQKLEEMKRLLTPFIQDKSPFKHVPKTNTKVTWVKPHYLCEVSFAEWTDDGMMRQPIFLGLRDDKPPTQVKPEIPE